MINEKDNVSNDALCIVTENKSDIYPSWVQRALETNHA